MATLLPMSQPSDEAQRYLAQGERLVSSFGPYHATSRRVLLINHRREQTSIHELPYTALESITEVSASDRKRMMLGACLAVLGLATLFLWYLILPIVAVVAGIFIVIQGATERPAYYQLKARGMEGEELHKWQVIHYGAGSFIASINMMTGMEITRD